MLSHMYQWSVMSANNSTTVNANINDNSNNALYSYMIQLIQESKPTDQLQLQQVINWFSDQYGKNII